MKNKKLHRILLLFLSITTIGFSQSGKVSVEIDTTNIRIGEQFTYKISINETDKVILPKLNLEGLEVVESLNMDTIKKRLIKKYILTGFDSGAFYIPQQQIYIQNKVHLTDSLLVNVATIKVDTTKVKKFEIKGIKSEPYQVDDFRHLWWIGVLLILIIGFLIYWFIIRKRKEEVIEKVKPKLPPYEQAMRALHDLDDKLLWQNNKTKEYYSELTEIIRTFVEDEFDVPAMECTSDEIVKKLSRMHRKKEIIAPNESLKKLTRLLQISDLVKFAKSKPMSDEIETDRKDAGNIINSLKPKKKEVIEDKIENKQ